MLNTEHFRRSLRSLSKQRAELNALERQLAVKIGRHLSLSRRNQALKLRHVAERVGLSIAKIHGIENGGGVLIDAETFDRLIEATERGAE